MEKERSQHSPNFRGRKRPKQHLSALRTWKQKLGPHRLSKNIPDSRNARVAAWRRPNNLMELPITPSKSRRTKRVAIVL
jgi:hypothetical protein